MIFLKVVRGTGLSPEVDVQPLTEPQQTRAEDADRVARFIHEWLIERQAGIEFPSRRVVAGRVAAAARARPGSQLYWEHEARLIATCSIQKRETSIGRQSLLQLRIADNAWSSDAARTIVDGAFETSERMVPGGRIALILPGGDKTEEALRERGFESQMSLITMMLSLRNGVPEIAAPDGVLIRSLRPTLDEEGYSRVQHEAFKDDPFGTGLSADDIRRQLEAGLVASGDFFLAELDGTLVGVARCVFDPEGRNPDDGPFAEIVGNGVLPEYRRHGIGQALIRGQLHRLHARGATSACLTVISIHPELIAHYNRVGFVETGRQTIWLSPLL